MYTILVVDDEKDIVSALEIYLKAEGYRVLSACNGKEALAAAAREDVHLILMDIMMPVMDGLSAMAQLRQASNVPVILLTAKGEDTDKVLGLNVGADDYITKPFSMEELVFRIEAILRRVKGKKNRDRTTYKIGSFTFDTQKQILARGEKQTKLTTKESELLSLLCAHANEILQRDFALKTIWIDDNYFNARSMDVYITKLRKHLKEDESFEIINIHGKGYKLIAPDVEAKAK